MSYQKWVDLLEYTFENTDIQVFTLRWLSTENASKRPKEEFDFLMNMYKEVGDKLDQILTKNQVNFKWIGNPDWITQWFKDYLDERQEKLKFPTDKYFVFGINYGWRDEILRGIKNLKNQNIDFDKIAEEDLTKSMDLWNIPPVELVIRTKWDEAQRISGFMLRWIGYAELYFTAKKCPEFDIPSYQEALGWFDKMAEKRNYGK